MDDNLLHQRRTYSEERLASLREMLATIPELRKSPDLCIYITGSYGRQEANPHSDLDIFFLHRGKRDPANSLTHVQKTLIDADIIRGCRELKFPEFTGGGQYLEIHYLGDILEQLGGPNDDARNYFTARMLLLLESKPLYNDNVYDEFLETIVGSYYRDYHEHELDFRPLFLVNDVVRYWKTMCLNYEQRRNQRVGDERKRNEHHIKNLKLKYSRLLICFSLIIAISNQRKTIDVAALLGLIRKSPLDRIRDLAGHDGCTDTVQSVLDDYAWFLEVTGKPKDDCLRWIADSERRSQAFNRARQFGRQLFALLNQVVSDGDTLRYIVM